MHRVLVALALFVSTAHADPLPRATYDFRIVRMDPKVIGTRATCDARVRDTIVGGSDVKLDCSTHDHSSTIIVAIPKGTAITKTDWSTYTQLEVEIDGEAKDADAHAKLVRVVGTTEDPRPSRCCRDRDTEPKQKPPEGFDFSTFKDKRQELWGKREMCVVGPVFKVGRSRTDLGEYGVERTFAADQLPYFADLMCHSKTGSAHVIVGATSTYPILKLRQGVVIEIELGWVAKYHSDVTGKLIAIRYEPRER
jgi:hypothetical protein